ncbi:NAD(P)H-binding protein [Hymenobacter humi]|uniref:NAD(P)H-binding protein n=1 Tax=Hymenobacter humi TaxID=1411620 RepID=A0ABW2U8C4_9BACT
MGSPLFQPNAQLQTHRPHYRRHRPDWRRHATPPPHRRYHYAGGSRALPAQAAAFQAQGIRSVLLDFDREETLAPALAGIDRVLLVTGYTVDMLRQSKAFLDQAHLAGVRHVVHLGACGPDDTTVAHWAWHRPGGALH